MTAITEQRETPVTRPLNVLIPLIKHDLAAAQQAGMPYYRAAGEKMLEAKPQMRHSEFNAWLKRHFKISYTQANLYMKLVAAETSSARAPQFESLHEFRKSRGERQTVYPRTWHEGVKQTIEQAKRDAERVRAAELTRAQERNAEQKLALRLIDIGYKVLAKELHPDKGGSREAMTRLNNVRNRLKQCI